MHPTRATEPAGDPRARDILACLEVPDQPNVFVLGAFASRLTFNAQQTRAFNLIWALAETGRLNGNHDVVVIGGGVAGLTVAAAAGSKGCNVTLFERNSDLLALQRGNYTRHIHPNILDWPAASSSDSSTRWPFLNWQADSVDKVIDAIEDGWMKVSKRLAVHARREVLGVVSVDGKPSIRVRSLDDPDQPPFEVPATIAVLATGFGLERTMERVPARSYWLNDSLHQEVGFAPAEPRRVLVSGCGDGGLIDVLRLCLRRFEHQSFVNDLLGRNDIDLLKERLLEIDRKAAEVPAERVSGFLADQYAQLQDVIPGAFLTDLFARVRRDVRVVLNGSDETPLSLRASILNRFPIYLLWQANHLDYKRGFANRVSGTQGSYLVNVEQATGTWVLEPFDDVIVRHGPMPVIDRLIPAAPLQKLKDRWPQRPDPTLQRHLWTNDYFPTIAEIEQPSDAQIAHLRLSDATAQLFRAGVAHVHVGAIGDRTGFVVSTRKDFDDKEKLTQLFGLPVRYEKIAPLREADTVAPPWDILQPGALIARGEVKGNRTSGTLGCFVRRQDGRVGFVTACHNFETRQPPLNVGVRVVQTDSHQQRNVREVGTVRKFVSMKESERGAAPGQGVIYNTMDIALADLDERVEYQPDFPEQYRLPPLGAVAIPKPGDVVFKVGGRTGLTRGRIVSVDTITTMDQHGNPIWLRSGILIEPDGDTRFGVAGDSGAVVARIEGDIALALGMLIGSDHQRHLAFALAPALEAMECEVLSPSRRRVR